MEVGVLLLGGFLLAHTNTLLACEVLEEQLEKGKQIK